jgi:hypothetical protein
VVRADDQITDIVVRDGVKPAIDGNSQPAVRTAVGVGRRVPWRPHFLVFDDQMSYSSGALLLDTVKRIGPGPLPVLGLVAGAGCPREPMGSPISEGHGDSTLSKRASSSRRLTVPTNSLHHSRWIAAALFCLIPLTVSVAAEAQGSIGNATIEVTPRNPTTADEITIKLSGMWPNQCAPNEVGEVSKVDLNITIDTFHSGGGSCGSGMRTWNLPPVEIGSLEEGRYQVTVRHCVEGGTVCVFRTIGTGNFVVVKEPDETPPTTPVITGPDECGRASQCMLRSHDPVTFGFDSCDPRTPSEPCGLIAGARADTELASRGGSDGTSSEQLLFATRLAPVEATFSGPRAGGSVTYDCLANGEYTLFVKAIDEAGNESGTAMFTFRKDVKDDTPPAILDLVGPSGVNRTDSARFKWGGADGGDPTPVRCLDFASRLLDREPDFSLFEDATSRDYAGLTNGDYTFEVKARDLAGKEATVARLAFTVSLPGTTPPDTKILSGPMGRTTAPMASFTWAGSGGDPVLARNLTYGFWLHPIESESARPFGDPSNATKHTYDKLDKGSYEFFVKARDQAGNEDPTPASRAFTVEDPDVAPPTVIVTPNIVSFIANQLMRVDATVANEGGEVAVDIYFGAVLPAAAGPRFGCPDRDAIVLVDSATPPGFQPTCLSSSAQRFQAWRRNVTLLAAQESAAVQNFMYTWGGAEPAGTYLLFLAVTPTGALEDGEIDATDILALGTKEITFSP